MVLSNTLLVIFESVLLHIDNPSMKPDKTISQYHANGAAARRTFTFYTDFALIDYIEKISKFLAQYDHDNEPYR